MKRRVVFVGRGRCFFWFVGVNVNMMLGWIVGVGPFFCAMVETHGGHRFYVGRIERSEFNMF